jgi:hypothetical protein
MNIHKGINSKATALKRFEREEDRKPSVIEIQRICLEWYGVYFKF